MAKSRALMHPTRKQISNPGPTVTPIASTSSAVFIPAFDSASAITSSIFSSWAFLAKPGTIPPHSSCISFCDASDSPRMTPSLRTIAAPVSSQLLSIPNTVNGFVLLGSPDRAVNTVPFSPPGVYTFAHCPLSTALAIPMNCLRFSLLFDPFLLFFFLLGLFDNSSDGVSSADDDGSRGEEDDDESELSVKVDAADSTDDDSTLSTLRWQVACRHLVAETRCLLNTCLDDAGESENAAVTDRDVSRAKTIITRTNAPNGRYMYRLPSADIIARTTLALPNDN
mmetsp:Transcript_11777/g.24254  ORF Transcript_11777/g.24254 Transcript_11777/m.24254 type:complete len:282 (-) Transcript_11777:110-955(-)